MLFSSPRLFEFILLYKRIVKHVGKKKNALASASSQALQISIAKLIENTNSIIVEQNH